MDSEEVEILESIYLPEEIQINWPANSVKVVQCPNDEEPDVKISLELTYPPGYPNEKPKFTIESTSLTPSERENLEANLNQVAEDNIGTQSSYALLSHLSEDFSALRMSISEKKREEEIKTNTSELEQWAAAKSTVRNRLPMTADEFNEWNDLRKTRDNQQPTATPSKKRALTGRELFEQHKAGAEDYEEE